MVAVDGRYRREPILLNLVPHTITPAISSVFATVPALVAAASERAGMRFLEFFAANIRNSHTRRAYARAAEEFLAWCASVGVLSIAAVQPVHVAAWIEAPTRELAAPSAKQRFATIRRLFDWLDHRPGRAGQSGARGARAAPRRHDRTNAGTRSRRSARAARQQRPVEAPGPARPRLDGAHGVFLRPHRRSARHGDRGCLHAKPPALSAAAREGWQAARHAVPPKPRRIPDGLSRRRRRSQGAAVSHDRPRHRPTHPHGAAAGQTPMR